MQFTVPVIYIQDDFSNPDDSTWYLEFIEDPSLQDAEFTDGRYKLLNKNLDFVTHLTYYGLMLDRKRELLDLQEVRIAEQAVEIDAKRMCGQLGIQPRDEPPERVRMIGLNAELFAQLTVDRFDDLAGGIDRPPRRG